MKTRAMRKYELEELSMSDLKDILAHHIGEKEASANRWDLMGRNGVIHAILESVGNYYDDGRRI
jgi:hypothetical protein